MKPLRGNFRHFIPFYYYRNSWQPVAYKLIYKQAFHPNVPKVRYTYDIREKGILWWAPDFGDFAPYPRVARTIAAQKVRKAFRAALAKRGFDEDGRKLVFDSEGNVVDKMKCLKGTLNLTLRAEPLMHAKRDAIEADCHRVVDALRKSNHRPIPAYEARDERGIQD